MAAVNRLLARATLVAGTLVALAWAAGSVVLDRPPMVIVAALGLAAAAHGWRVSRPLPPAEDRGPEPVETPYVEQTTPL